MTESKSPKQVDNGSRKVTPMEITSRQPPSQGRDGGRNERRVTNWVRQIVVELEVLQVWKQPNEEHKLPTGPYGFPQGERLERR